MKSKTSCFSLPLFKRGLKMTLLSSVILFIILFQRGAYGFQKNFEAYANWTAEETLTRKGGALSMLALGGQSCILAFFAVLLAVVSFSYIYKRSSNQMLHALPFTRTQLFLTNYASGFLALVLPVVLNGFIMECVVREKTLWGIIFQAYSFLLVAAVLFYNFAVLMCVICGVFYLPPILFLIFNVLYVVFRNIFDRIVSVLLYGYMGTARYSWYEKPSIEYILSPLYYLYNSNSIGFMEESTHIEFSGGNTYLFYIIPIVICFVLAWFAYKRRPAECCGDFLTKSWLKIFFSMGISLCASTLVLLLLTQYEGAKEVQHTLGMLNPLITLFITFAISILVAMGIRKNLCVKRKDVLIPSAICAVVACISMGVVQFDAFGVEKSVPRAKEIAKCSATALYESDYEGLQLATEEVIKLHRRLVDEKEFVLETKAKVSIPVTIRYEYKDGRKIARKYDVPYIAECLKNKESLNSYIEEYFNNFKRYCEPVYSKELLSATFTLCGEKFQYKEVELDNQKFMEAFMADVESGAIRMDYPELYADGPQRKEDGLVYADIFTAEFKTKKPASYWGGMTQYSTSVWANENLDGEKTNVIEFHINDRCIHLLKYLKSLDIEKTDLWIGDLQ